MVTEINKLAQIEQSTELRTFQNKARRLEDINNILVHNLRGIASNIKMLVEVLLNTHVYKNEETCKLARSFSLEQGLSYIEESSSSLISILNNLMKGIETGQDTNAVYEECNFSEMISDIAVQLNGFVHEKNATIQTILGITHIDYPKCYLESLLYNLISNALKYTHPDRAAEITIATWESGGRTILSVKDNGIGIDLEKHGDKIFNFGQVFHSGYDSKGIGLYITRKQIESLGGTITVQSTVNEGTEFIVTF